MNDKQRRAMFAKIHEKKCDYNFGCEDYAKDGTSKSWAYRVNDNAPAKHNIKFYNKSQGINDIIEYDVCDGCLLSIQPINDDDPDEDVVIVEESRIAPPTESYLGKKSNKYSTVYQVPSEKEYEKSMARLRKNLAMTTEQRDQWFKKQIPKLRKTNMKSYGRYIIDENGNYIGDKELEKIHGRN